MMTTWAREFSVPWLAQGSAGFLVRGHAGDKINETQSGGVEQKDECPKRKTFYNIRSG